MFGRVAPSPGSVGAFVGSDPELFGEAGAGDGVTKSVPQKSSPLRAANSAQHGTARFARHHHGGCSHEANHPPIIEQKLWYRVQATLAANKNGDRKPAPTESSLLAGKLVDDRGVPMVATHSCKGKVRYRYYVSRDLHHSGDARGAAGWRLPAREIEPLVRIRIIRLLNYPLELFARAGNQMPAAGELNAIPTGLPFKREHWSVLDSRVAKSAAAPTGAPAGLWGGGTA